MSQQLLASKNHTENSKDIYEEYLLQVQDVSKKHIQSKFLRKENGIECTIYFWMMTKMSKKHIHAE
jgi:hypothetical protein